MNATSVKTRKGPMSTTMQPDNDPRVSRLLSSLRKDPRLAPLVGDFQKTTEKPGRRFGSNGLKANGKLFALFTQGTLVVKLPKTRVAELVDAKLGKPFDPGHGRVMKEWLTVISPKASWFDLVIEAFGFVSTSKR